MTIYAHPYLKSVGWPDGTDVKAGYPIRSWGSKTKNKSGRILRLIAKHEGLCFWCGKEPDFPTADHVIPRSKGGTSDPENLVLSCGRCNGLKGNMMPDEFRDFMDLRPDLFQS